MHQACTGQPGVAAQPGCPGQQARTQQRTNHDGHYRVARAHGGHQVGTNLHDQQAHTQAEPE